MDKRLEKLVEQTNRYMIKLNLDENDGYADRPMVSQDPFKSNYGDSYPRTTDEEQRAKLGRGDNTEQPRDRRDDGDRTRRDVAADEYDQESVKKGGDNLLVNEYNELLRMIQEVSTKTAQLTTKLTHIIDTIPDANSEEKDKLDGIGDQMYADIEQMNDVLTSITQMLGSVDSSREREDEEQFRNDRIEADDEKTQNIIDGE